MHLSRIDLNLLVVFDTVFAAGSITAASHKLNLSQPAVSHALARLRDVFGEPLFERQGRGIAPTPLARSIAGPVREALGRWSARSARLRVSNRHRRAALPHRPARGARTQRAARTEQGRLRRGTTSQPVVRKARPPSSRNGSCGRRIRRRARRAAAGSGSRAARARAHRSPGGDRTQGPSAAAPHAAQRLEPGRLPGARSRAGVVAPARPLAGRRRLAVARPGPAHPAALPEPRGRLPCRRQHRPGRDVAGDVCTPRSSSTCTRSWDCRSPASASRPTCTGQRMRQGMRPTAGCVTRSATALRSRR